LCCCRCSEFSSLCDWLNGYSKNEDARLTFGECDVGARISAAFDTHECMAVIVGYTTQCAEPDPTAWGYRILLDSGELKWYASLLFVYRYPGFQHLLALYVFVAAIVQGATSRAVCV
jgi:hypothetical protein